MNCDICKKQLLNKGTLLRFKSHWPDRLITNVVRIHKACDTHPWPADGYGHIDARAMGITFTQDLISRANTEAAKNKIQELWRYYGDHGHDDPSSPYHWSHALAATTIDESEIPF
jgi:hypothetical protein